MEPILDLRYPKAKFKAVEGNGDIINPRYERIESDGIQSKRIIEYFPYVTALVLDAKEEKALGAEWKDSPTELKKEK
jgi:hypothetical protein